jgi:hypothetical protein
MNITSAVTSNGSRRAAMRFHEDDRDPKATTNVRR